MLWYVSKIVNVVFCNLLVTQVVEPSHGSSAFSFLRSSVVNEERMRPVGGFLSWVWCFEFPSVASGSLKPVPLRHFSPKVLYQNKWMKKTLTKVKY